MLLREGRGGRHRRRVNQGEGRRRLTWHSGVEVEEAEEAQGHDGAGPVAHATDECGVSDVQVEWFAGCSVAEDCDGARARGDVEEKVCWKCWRRRLQLAWRRRCCPPIRQPSASPSFFSDFFLSLIMSSINLCTLPTHHRLPVPKSPEAIRCRKSRIHTLPQVLKSPTKPR